MYNSTRRIKFNLFDIINYMFMFIFAFSIIYPFWDMLMKSFSTPAEATKVGFNLFPKELTFAAYKAVFLGSDIAIGYFNTIFRTFFGTLLFLLVTVSAAFALSKKDLPCRNTITFFFLFTMFFSGGLIPSYILMKWLHLIDSRWALIIPGMFNVFNMVIIRNYMQSIDKSLEESASMDGANHIYILFKIIVPVCKPILATVALWTIVGHWNAWFDAMIYINTNKKQVLQIFLRKILIQYDNLEVTKFLQASGQNINDFTPDSLKAAFMYITITPILFAYPLLQKYFVKGIMIGSLKG
ncbi:MAG: carbohydrate ABC transporter permease [Firmicutes bacterium]|nr:carbohydrate ABC transporter permease [Bacillota bacterium]